MTLSDKNRLQRFQDGLGYRFKNEAELRQALTHRSFKAAHYERQEFLGDAVLKQIRQGNYSRARRFCFGVGFDLYALYFIMNCKV